MLEFTGYIELPPGHIGMISGERNGRGELEHKTRYGSY